MNLAVDNQRCKILTEWRAAELEGRLTAAVPAQNGIGEVALDEPTLAGLYIVKPALSRRALELLSVYLAAKFTGSLAPVHSDRPSSRQPASQHASDLNLIIIILFTCLILKSAQSRERLRLDFANSTRRSLM